MVTTGAGSRRYPGLQTQSRTRQRTRPRTLEPNPMRRFKLILPLATFAAAVLVAGAAAFGVIDEPLPIGYVGQPYSYQFTASGGEAPYEFTLDNGSLPPGLSLSRSGALTGTPTVAGTWNFYIEGSYFSTGLNARKYSQRQFTLSVVQGLVIQQTSVPVMTRGTAVSIQLTATGGGTQTWSVSGGALPAGLGLSGSGVLSGTPTAVGSSSFTVRVADGARSDTQNFTAEVIEALVGAAPEFPPAVVGSDFNASMTASGGRPPYTWSIKDGAWPRGLKFANGVISGRPRAAGSFAFTVAVTDVLHNTADVPVTLLVNPRLKIPLQTVKPGALGKVYRNLIVAKGGARPLTFEVADGDLPPGIRLNAKTGALVGKPRLKGRYGFTIVVADQIGNTHQRSFVLRVR